MPQPLYIDITVLSINLSLYGQEHSGHEQVNLESMSNHSNTLATLYNVNNLTKSKNRF